MTNAIATIALEITEGRPTTTSNIIAAQFGKRHDNVLRQLEALRSECGDKFNALNFEVVEYLDAKGERRPAYRLTRDGFTLLAMGFTGKKALQFKLAYIEAFNKMEAALAPKASTALLPSQKRDLQNKIAEIAYKLPSEQRSAKFADIYRKLKNEFHVATYSEISQDQYDHAFALVESFDVITKIEAPKLKIDNHTYGASQVCISHLRNQVYGNPAAMETIEHLEKCLVASYSRVEEAKFRLSVANTMLSSWING